MEGRVSGESEMIDGGQKVAFQNVPEDEDDEVLNNTLYELTDLQEYTARKVEADDIRPIRNLLKDEDYYQFRFEDPLILYETCCFSLVISDIIETDRLVAAAFFDDTPASPDLLKNSKKWKPANDLRSMVPINTYYMRCFICSPEVAEDVCLTEIISHTFSSSVHMDYIVVEMPDLNYTGPYAFSPLVKQIEVNLSGKQKRKIIVYQKDLLMPHLIVREGREHDLDDLVPLLPMETQVMEQHFGKSNLSDIIALSERGNQSMTAEWKAEAVGIISVSADIDYEMLNNFYHLAPFHGLRKPHRNDEIYIDDKPISRPKTDSDYERLLKTAKHTFRETRSDRQNEGSGSQPYDVEVIKSFSMCSVGASDSDAGSDKAFAERAQGPHLFTVRVSEDILMYELKPKDLDPAEFGCGVDRTSGSKSDMPSEGTAGSNEDAGFERLPVEMLKVVSPPRVGSDDERASSNVSGSLLEVVIEEVGEDGVPKFTIAEKGQGVEIVEIVDGEDAGTMPDEEGSKSRTTLPIVEEEEDVESYSWDREDDGYDFEDQSAEREGTEKSGSTEIAADEDDDEFMALDIAAQVKALAKSVAHLGEEAGNKSFSEPGNSAEGLDVDEGQGSEGNETSADKLSQRNLELLDQFPPIIRQKLSDDTLIPGKPDRTLTLNDKVEMFKRIWDVYNLIQDAGITLEEAKESLSRTDLNILRETDLLSNTRLQDYITALIPNDSSNVTTDEPTEVKKTIFRGIANALAVKLFNMGRKYMLRNMDMFRDIFKSFPNREYLIVTVPVGGNVREPPWLDNFVRVIPKAETSYPRDLFLLHKIVITSKVRVRRARERDMGPVQNFLNSLIEKEKIFQDFLSCFDKSPISSRVQRMTAYVLQVKNYPGQPIIGLAIVSPDMEAEKYVVNYELEKHTYSGAHVNSTAHAYVHHLLINPLFQRQARLFLKEVMRLDEKESLFHRVYPEFIRNGTTQHQSILNNMEDWIPLMPRKRIHYDDLNLKKTYDDERQPLPYAQQKVDPQPYAVIHTAKRFVMEPKITLTKRIVFVGASTTTLSCLEKLISSTYRSFKYLTIIDPYGLPGTLPDDPVRNEFFAMRNGGTKMSYSTDFEWVQRTGINLWVKVVIGKVTKIVRDSKYVVVNSDCIVPYDKLILAPGLQFQRLDCPKPEINDPNFMAFKKNTAASVIQQEASRNNFNRDAPRPKNAFTINNEFDAQSALDYLRKFKQFMEGKKILIFGGGLQTYTCIKALLACGMPPKSIVLINTPESEIEWERKSGYTLSSKVRNPMEQELGKLGVNTISNYEFDHWEICPISSIVTRTYFKSLTERHAQISFPTYAIFCYRYKRMDDGIVSALSEAYILYQTGIVIDVGFRTNDPDVYAAGPATTYQKILLADHQNHIYYQSEEIGHKLAEFIIDSSGTEGGGQGSLEDLNVIKFHKPLTRAITLPGGWHYMYLRTPGSLKRCNDLPGSTCEETCECLTEVVTGSINAAEDPEQKFFKVRLNDKSRIVSLECMSKVPFSFSNMSALFGKHERMLNKMMERLEVGETTCLYNHFKQSWFAVFCIDEWDNFAEELKDLYKEHDIGDGTKLTQFIRDFIANLDNPEAHYITFQLQMDPNIIRSVWRSSKLKEIVEDRMLNFIKFHRTSLPMYAEHNYVEDLLEERSTSALYYPNTKAHMAQ